MKPTSEDIRLACVRLASLLEDAKDNSGPWHMIPAAAAKLYQMLGEVLPQIIPKLPDGQSDADESEHGRWRGH